MNYVAIEGVIGVGKTSLARTLAPRMQPAELVLEIVEENPFLSDFYRNTRDYAFQTQLFFLLSRFRQQQQLSKLPADHLVICDYLFAKDRIFARQTLARDELDMHGQVFSIMHEQLRKPGLVVYLRARTPTLMHRIALRDRPFERAMAVEYIERLNQEYEAFFGQFDECKVLSIDTDDLDLINNQEHIDRVIGLIRTRLFQDDLFSLGGDGRREEVAR